MLEAALHRKFGVDNKTAQDVFLFYFYDSNSYCEQFEKEPSEQQKKKDDPKLQQEEAEPEEMKEFINSFEKFDKLEKERSMKIQTQKAA